LSSFTLGPGFARPGIVAHLSSSKPRGHPALMSIGVTCRLGVSTRHPIDAEGVKVTSTAGCLRSRREIPSSAGLKTFDERTAASAPESGSLDAIQAADDSS